MMLGELIERLEKEDKEKKIAHGFDSPHSYRGYYDQLAFEPAKNITIREMLKCAKEAMGRVYSGYKGGEFEMGEFTDVYIAYYGKTGEELGYRLLEYMLKDIVE